MCVFVEVERRRNESRPEWEFCFIAPCWPVAWSHFSFSLCFIKQRGGGGGFLLDQRVWDGASPPTHPLRLPSILTPHPTHTHTQWLIDTAFSLTGPFVETPIVHGQSNWSVISRGVLRGGAVCVCVCLTPACSRTKTRTLRWRQTLHTSTPLPHKHTHTHWRTPWWSLFCCDEWPNEQPGVCVCVFKREGDESNLGH